MGFIFSFPIHFSRNELGILLILEEYHATSFICNVSLIPDDFPLSIHFLKCNKNYNDLSALYSYDGEILRNVE